MLNFLSPVVSICSGLVNVVPISIEVLVINVFSLSFLPHYYLLLDEWMILNELLFVFLKMALYFLMSFDVVKNYLSVY